MKAKYDFIIGIDPDREKSGVGMLRVEDKQYILVSSIEFPNLIEFLKSESKECQKAEKRLIVVVEAGWLVSKSNYHPMQGHRGEKIAHDVGANHETGKKIIEMCKYYGIEVVEQHPLKKIWKGPNGKITAEELKHITKYALRTNQDSRDAALIAWYYADFPIVINPLNFLIKRRK